MKSPLLVAAAAATLIAQTAAAQPYGGQYPQQQGQYQQQYPQGPYQPYRNVGPSRDYQDGYKAGYRNGYQAGRVRGRYDDRPILTSITPQPQFDPNQRWRQRYGQTYTTADNSFYRECRNQPDPGAVIAGALIGGLLGNAVSHGGARGPSTVAGIIVGGALGAALTSNMDCSDRSYAYKTYYDGFNSGRPHSDWQWDNPQNGHYGDFRVGDYYTDQDGFRCASYTQQIYVGNEPQAAAGQACQQPDGTWAIVN